ncbi:MAG: hypothetical protein N2Z40_00145 [Caldimicrobium sp.]|nr:hypothetical protein [Caldimicrobium sp.]
MMLRIFTLFGLIILFKCYLIVIDGRSQVQRGIIKEFLHNASKASPEQERLIHELDNAYKIKDYESVVKIYQSLSPQISLSAEEFLKIAESLFRTGEPKKAIDLAERAVGLRRGTEIACKGRLLKSKALFLLGKERDAVHEIKVMSDDFCKELLIEELRALRVVYLRSKEERPDPKILKALTEELLASQISFQLKSGKFKEAENTIYDYLNLTGEYKKGKDYFFKLAELYMAKNEVNQAKRFYQLIITEWDHTREAFFSKFRLYQIAYDRAPVKDLLPAKTVEDLLLYITQIKTKYPKETIAEEASFLGIRIYSDKRNWEKVRERAKEFFKSYPDSLYKSKALEFYCKASESLVPLKFLKGEVSDITKIVEEDGDYLREARCGKFYYLLGSEFFKYKLWSLGLHYLLLAYELGVTREYQPDLYLKLAYLADERGNLDLFQILINYLEKKWGKDLKDSPEYLYLQTKKNLRHNLESGLRFLEVTMKKPLRSTFKEELFDMAFYKSLQSKRYSQAYLLIKTYQDMAKFDHHLGLLLETFTSDPRLFEEILKESQKKFPNNPSLMWLEAYHLERRGELKRTPEIWEKLRDKQGIAGEVAKGYQTFRDLVDRAQNLVY